MAEGSIKTKKELNKVKTWLDTNHLILNANKTKFITFTDKSTSLYNYNVIEIRNFNFSHTNE